MFTNRPDTEMQDTAKVNEIMTPYCLTYLSLDRSPPDEPISC